MEELLNKIEEIIFKHIVIDGHDLSISWDNDKQFFEELENEIQKHIDLILKKMGD